MTAPFTAKAGSIRVNKKDGQKYVWISPGTFTMGCLPSDEVCGTYAKPAHRVTITKGFWMAQTATTVAAYKAFAAATHRDMPKAPKFNPDWSKPNDPIVEVNWDDAVAYSTWAGARAGAAPTHCWRNSTSSTRATPGRRPSPAA